MLYKARINAAFNKIAYDKSGSVGIGHDDQAALFGKSSQKLLLFLVVEHAKAARFDYHGIDDLRERVFIISALDDNDLGHLMHALHLPQCA